MVKIIPEDLKSEIESIFFQCHDNHHENEEHLEEW